MRPGPLVQVVQVVPAVQTAAVAEPVQPPHTLYAASAPLPKHRAQQLSASLQRLAPVFDAIQQAQACSFIDARFEAQYKRLAQQAEQLLQQLRSQRR
jgi:hypothetical protein